MSTPRAGEPEGVRDGAGDPTDVEETADSSSATRDATSAAAASARVRASAAAIAAASASASRRGESPGTLPAEPPPPVGASPRCRALLRSRAPVSVEAEAVAASAWAWTGACKRTPPIPRREPDKCGPCQRRRANREPRPPADQDEHWAELRRESRPAGETPSANSGTICRRGQGSRGSIERRSTLPKLVR
jgi:hypothetical protein